MSRFFDLVSKPAREMAGYTPGPPPAVSSNASQEPLRLIRLDSNENPFGPALRALDAMRTAVANSGFYPDDDCSALRQKLAAQQELPVEQVLVTAGSTEMISLLCQTLLGTGYNAVTSERSFIVYSLAVHAVGAELREAPMLDDGYDLRAVYDRIDDYTRLVFLANPNNPTGTIVDADLVEEFLAHVPAHVVVVLDEAYYDFAMHLAAQRGMMYSRSLDYVRKGASVVVLRTFSKAHGLAGLRIGYGLGPAELMAYCARMRNTFSVSSVAQAAALAAMDDRAHIQRIVAVNAEQTQIVAKSLAELGYRVTPTYANFLYCDVGSDAGEVARRLREVGVSVRPLGVWGAPNCLRVSIGTPEQNQAFLKAARTAGIGPRS